jgi:DNA-binding MarR family transcriptional regulator
MRAPREIDIKKANTLYEIIRYIRPLYRYLAEAVSIELEDTGVTVPMRAVLEYLNENEEKTVPNIARSLMLKNQYVQDIVNDLLDEELVERIENPAHRRSWLIGITAVGAGKINAIREREQVNLVKVGADLKLNEIRTCLRVMAHLHDSFADIKRWREKNEG